MKTQKRKRPSTRDEADYYRQKAKDADHAAETAETAEAKQFYLKIAKNYYLMAENTESGSTIKPSQTTRPSPRKTDSGWISSASLWGRTPKIEE